MDKNSPILEGLSPFTPRHPKYEALRAHSIAALQALESFITIDESKLIQIDGMEEYFSTFHPVTFHCPFVYDAAGSSVPAGRHYATLGTYRIYISKAPDDEVCTDVEPMSVAGYGVNVNVLLALAAEYNRDRFPDQIAAIDEYLQDIAEFMGDTPPVKKTETTPRIAALPVDLLSYPLDKINKNIWDMLAVGDDGQLRIDFDITSYADRKKGKNAVVYYCINFDGLESDMKMTKTLTHFDKRVYVAAAALFSSGNSVMSATQIYKTMGNRSQPKSQDIKKINDSLTKMGTARVYIDSSEEVKVNKGYPKFIYDAPLLPFERISAHINNTLCETAIQLFREPPLITFARERKNITTLPRELLESPISKTDNNLMIDHYLIERISKMKNTTKTPRKILYKSLFEKCKITTRTQKSRAPEKIKRYLEHYKECGFISDYSEEKDGVTISI